MRKVSIRAKFHDSPDSLWKTLENIRDWSKYVKFVWRIEGPEKIKVGDEWSDITTIVFVPLSIKHRVTKMTPKKELRFFVPLFFGGQMDQSFLLTPVKEGTDVQMEITFDLGNPIFNYVVGPILTHRLQVMLNDTLKNLERKINERKIT